MIIEVSREDVLTQIQEALASRERTSCTQRAWSPLVVFGTKKPV